MTAIGLDSLQNPFHLDRWRQDRGLFLDL